jgi:hypothetical protein
MKFKYTRLTKCWYASSILSKRPDLVDDIMVAAFDELCEDGGVRYEFKAEWLRLETSGGIPAMRVSVFDDAFSAFAHLGGVFRKLAELDQNGSARISPVEFEDILQGFGIQPFHPRDPSRDARSEASALLK